MSVVMGVLALAIDVGNLRYQEERIQTVADTAAMAGALEVSTCGSTSNCSAMQTAAQSAVVENGLASPTVVTQCGTSSASGVILEVNNGPCALGTKDPNNGNTQYVEAVVTEKQSTFFGALLGLPQMTLAARSEATAGGAGPACIYTLGSSGITGSGSGSIDASSCVIDDNAGITLSGSLSITAQQVKIMGTNTDSGSSSVSPSPTTVTTAATNPLASLSAPTVPSGSCTSVGSSGTISLSPGVLYCGIVLSGSATLDMSSSGTYFIEGITTSGTPTIEGTGVTIYMPTGGITGSGTTNWNLTAPTSGTYDGIALWLPSTNSSGITLSGSSSSTFEGIVLAPDAGLTFSGSTGFTLTTDLIVGNMTFSGTTSIDNYNTVNSSNVLETSGGGGAALAE